MWLPGIYERARQGLLPAKKKVYCINCIHYEKRKVKEGEWTSSIEIDFPRYNTFCNHPTNLKGKRESWDSYERRHYYKRWKKKHPRQLNGDNKCKWYEDMGAQGEAKWEV